MLALLLKHSRKKLFHPFKEASFYLCFSRNSGRFCVLIFLNRCRMLRTVLLTRAELIMRP